jgi:hypothetical protein
MKTDDGTEFDFDVADIFEPGEIIEYWHPGCIRFCDVEGNLTGEHDRLSRGTHVKIVKEHCRFEGIFPGINYVVEIVTEGRGQHLGDIPNGTFGIVGSPHLLRFGDVTSEHAINKMGWCI